MQGILQGLWDFLSKNKDAITSAVAILGVVGGILVVIWGAWKLVFERWWKGRLRIDIDVFDVTTEPDALLPKLFATENDESPLADHRVTYQRRSPRRDIQAELKATLNRTRYLLVTAPTGYGKTREAGVLAQTMMLEGWRVLLVKKTGWLDVPKTFPEALKNNRSRVLIILDDLNGLFSTGERTQSPRAEQIPMLSEASYHDQLLRTLDMFEAMCTQNEIRVIGTARSEADQWSLLDYHEDDKLWKRFERFELSEPVDTAIVGLLRNSTKRADLKANPEDFTLIAHKSDGTYRNVVLNLRRWEAQSKEVSKDDFTETLEGSWLDVYQHAVNEHRAVKYIYEAIDVLRQAGIELFPFLIRPTAAVIWGGNVFQRLLRKREIQRALFYLTEEKSILRIANRKLAPSDGQIEAKGA